MFSPAGAVDTDGGIDGAGRSRLAASSQRRVGPAVEMLGMGKRVVMPLRETWCAVKKKIATGKAIMPMTKTASNDPQRPVAARVLGRWARKQPPP